LPTNTMPLETAGPAMHGGGMGPKMPSFVSAVWCQSTAPVFALRAYIEPFMLQPNRTPFASVTAPSARAPFAWPGGGDLNSGSGVVHFTLPVAASIAAQPPAFVTVPFANVQSPALAPPPFLDC